MRLDWRAIERQARETLAAWRSLATRHIADGRKLLGSLLDGPIVFTPFEETGSANRVLSLVISDGRGGDEPARTGFVTHQSEVRAGILVDGAIVVTGTGA